MQFFDKMRETLSKFSRSSAEVARESIGKLSEKATEYSQISKLKMEIKSIEHKMDEVFTELGGEYYHLLGQGKGTDPAAELKKQLETIGALKQELAQKEQELLNTYEKYSSTGIKKEKLKQLKEELESGGGTIEQIEIKEDSPVLGKKLKTVRLPREVLVGTILRGDQVIIPDGTYSFEKDDRVTLLGKRQDVREAVNILGAREPEE